MSKTSTSHILITGATSGIGRDAALALARLGHHVIATGRRKGALASLAREAEGTRLTTLELDVTDSASIESAREVVEHVTGGHGLDVLINNAGFGIAAPLSEIGETDLRRQFDTNLFGLMAVTRAFLGEMMRRRAGRIINVSSIGGRVTFPFFGAYNATKYALESMSDALRVELGAFGIQVVLVEPGPIRTNFGEVTMDWVGRYQSDESPYAAVYRRASAVHARFEKSAASPAVVTRAIVRAVRARRPSARYVAPARYGLLLAVLGLLPTRWVDAAMRRLLGLTPGALAPPAGSRPKPSESGVRAAAAN